MAGSKRIAGRHSPLPGLGLTLGINIFYLSVLVVLPLGALILSFSEASFSALLDALSSDVFVSGRIGIQASIRTDHGHYSAIGKSRHDR